jgi:hypothetical protein
MIGSNSDDLILGITKKFKIIINSIRRIEHVKDKKLIFILGCQRSGTTMLSEIFEKDLNTFVFGERSEVTGMGLDGLRLKKFADVRKIVSSRPGKIMILKPIVESQNSIKLLDCFKNSKAIWIYRNFKDVVLSNARKFGMKNGIKDLKSVINNGVNDWRSEHVPQVTINILKKYYDDEMPPYDAAALFWLVRNSFYFDLFLHDYDRVFLCKYEELVLKPSVVMNSIYRWIGEKFPGNRCIKQVRSSSVDKGNKIYLSDNIEQLCAQMMERFDDIYFNAYLNV